jgi:tryptophan halogenase
MVEWSVYTSGEQTMINKVREIIIFGGGTSGWLTAAYLINNLKNPIKVTLIESTELGPIGVGEGTQPATARFLYDCGLEPRTWMKPSRACFKLGVEFVETAVGDRYVMQAIASNNASVGGEQSGHIILPD